MNDEDVNSWSKFRNWQSVVPPSRPADWQIEMCRKSLSRLPKIDKVAVLGSTIEYREMLVSSGYENVYVFDRNKDFYNYITPFVKTKLNEVFVRGNWIDTIFDFAGEFDVVLSDLTSGNISYAHRRRFYDALLSFGIPRIKEFVFACYDITPRDCVWWYSKPWSEEIGLYERYFVIDKIYDEPSAGEYYGRAKFLISSKRSSP
jgi:hypothetical protein